MKNNKIDSDILDDNFFPEEEENAIEFNNKVRIFFKVIGYSIINITFYIFSIFFLFVVIFPIVSELSFIPWNVAIWSMMLISYVPFIWLLYWHIKKENLLNSNCQIWISFLTFLVIIIFTYGAFEISNFQLRF